MTVDLPWQPSSWKHRTGKGSANTVAQTLLTALKLSLLVDSRRIVNKQEIYLDDNLLREFVNGSAVNSRDECILERFGSRGQTR